VEIVLIIVGILVLAALGAVVYLLLSIKSSHANKLAAEELAKAGESSSSTLLLQQLNEVTRQLQEQSRTINDSSRGQTADIRRSIDAIKDQVTAHLVEVAKGVTEANTASKQIFTIADQLGSLEKVLKHQKQRGTLGEASLELILANILPPDAYSTQFRFPDGETVDAVIKTKEGFIPVDAKFSLDNYLRLADEVDEVRKVELEKMFRADMIRRIDETAKYIRPNDGTLPFAFMFIPTEGIYYDLLVNEIGTLKSNTRNLLDYSYNDKKVIVVSPTTFSAYLQSVLYGFKAFKIEESAQQIRKQVGELQKHLKGYEEYHSKMGKALGVAVSHYNVSDKTLRSIDKDVFKITGEKMGIETTLLDKPEVGE
jgi:DNA recombination protein RmuC